MLNTMGYNHFFCFRPEVIPYLGELGSKNGPFKLKFGTQTNSNFDGDVHFIFFRQDISF